MRTPGIVEGRFAMSRDSDRPAGTLPPSPSLEYLKKEAKRRLKALRLSRPQARLAQIQLALAREHGFSSWRALKAHVDEASEAAGHVPVFEAARRGDLAAVRRALEAGFDPGLVDAEGRTIHQIAKVNGHEAVELLTRQFQERDTRPEVDRHVVDTLLDAAAAGDAETLGRLLDARPDLIDARGGNFQKQTALHKSAWHNRQGCVRLLLERGANVRIRDFGDNAYALHFAAEAADIEIVRWLVEAGSDVAGDGDDHQLGVIGWATCFRQVRADVADYLLAHGARLNLWAAIALGRVEAVASMLAGDPSLTGARMSRSEHHRTALHHAAVANQPEIVRLLIERGADIQATDATGATPLTTAAHESADPRIVAALLAAGARYDFAAALNLKRYDLAEAMLAEDPGRLGPDGRDTIALHLAVSRKNAEAVRWLIAHGVHVDARRLLWDCNQTALHMAAAEGLVEIARMLLDAGADPSIRDGKYESSVLGWAEFCGQKEVADLLRSRAAGG